MKTVGYTVTYKVKDLIGDWTSPAYKTLEEAQADLARTKDRVGMMECPHNYVVVEEEVVTTHFIVE